MNAISKFDMNNTDAAALPEAPVAMPIQLLEPARPFAFLRMFFGFGNRSVKQ